MHGCREACLQPAIDLLARGAGEPPLRVLHWLLHVRRRQDVHNAAGGRPVHGCREACLQPAIDLLARGAGEPPLRVLHWLLHVRRRQDVHESRC